MLKNSFLRINILSFFLLFFSFTVCFAQENVNIISPIEGTWANRQSLVLEIPENTEVYYSYTGSDPLNFGFAYDGPVLIDAIGSVPLKLAIVNEDGLIFYKKITYNVIEPDIEWETSFNQQSPYVQYCVGDEIVIPEDFTYCLGDNSIPDISGQILKLDGGTFPERFIPCTVFDGNNYWRFVIGTSGHTKSAIDSNIIDTVESYNDSVLDVEFPFEMQGWDSIEFTEKNIIYCIDDNYWELASGTIPIDRTESHTIYWQSVAYEVGNPIYSFVLPAKPNLENHYEGNSFAKFQLEEGYTLKLKNSNEEPCDYFIFDAFVGEKLSDEVIFDVYLKNFYQGEVAFSFLIDKEPPRKPRILANSTKFYNRNAVNFTIEGNPSSEIFYKIELVEEKSSGFNDFELKYDKDVIAFDDSFLKYETDGFIVDSSKGNASFYKIFSYSVDEFGNISSPSEYPLIIDPSNYYVSNRVAEDMEFPPDGSFARPFTSLEDVVQIANKSSFTRIHLDGMIQLKENIEILSKCEINGIDSTSGISCTEDIAILIKDKAQVAFNNCVLELKEVKSPKQETPALFKIFNSTVSLSKCELVAGFFGSGSIFISESSSISLDECGASIKSGRYASLFSGVKTNLMILGGRYTAVAPTAVIFSMSAGIFNLQDTQCNIFSNLGRIAELSGVTASVFNNFFEAELSGDSVAASRIIPIWFDGRSQFLKNENNKTKGFPGGDF